MDKFTLYGAAPIVVDISVLDTIDVVKTSLLSC